MNKRLVVVGTDTGVGKTTFAAALAGALDGVYWKPVQAGDLDETDADVVRRLSGLAPKTDITRGLSAENPGVAASRRGDRRHHDRSKDAGSAGVAIGR